LISKPICRLSVLERKDISRDRSLLIMFSGGMPRR